MLNRNLPCLGLFIGLFALRQLAVISVCEAAGPSVIEPSRLGLDADRLAHINTVVEEGLEQQKMPGCVVCIGRSRGIAFLKSYGFRQLEPSKTPMTTDTVFDLASLTKPIATATSIMMLIEQGVLRLDDPVSKHLPDFAFNGKDEITIQDLLTHVGGLTPDNALSDYDEGYAVAIEKINALDLRAEPGERFIYSDVGFIVLAEVVKAKTGQNIHEFTQQNLFGPLGMRETGYLPPERLQRRAATTEQREDRWMRGEVHDPRAYRMGGIAGHAGLFSTAEDLARYATMMLRKGTRGERRLLAARTVEVMTEAYEVSSGFRGLGWDKSTRYSSNRGELMTGSAFGHGGFTGTGIWIDPELDLFVIFLSNRVHPDGSGSVNPLIGRIGTIAVASLRHAADNDVPNPAAQDSLERESYGQIATGIDRLEASGFTELNGLRVGLITNQTGISRDGRSTAEILHGAPQVQLRALFSPEHGFEGQLDQAIVADSQDPNTGLKIYSLYGETRRPTPEMLSDLDALVFDIQDIGARFYTYISTMGEAMIAAGESDIQFFVLDRPNPINGIDVEGPVLDAGRESFVGFHSLPVRHGMTVGELARMIRAERQLDVDLQVIEVSGWDRSDYFDQTGLLWINPSPNMRSLTEAVLYPGIGLLETTNLSVGRGTDTPFEVIGAPWLDAQKLAERLNKSRLAGVAFVPIRFRPESSKFADEDCQGINILITDREHFRPVRTGLQIATLLRQLHPDDWQIEGYDRLLGDEAVLKAVSQGANLAEIEAAFKDELNEFKRRRQGFLLY